MKVLKPQRVAVLTRPYEVRRELRLGVSVLLFVPLGDERALLPEVSLWPVAAEEMGAPVLDVGIPKLRSWPARRTPCSARKAGSAPSEPRWRGGRRPCSLREIATGKTSGSVRRSHSRSSRSIGVTPLAGPNMLRTRSGAGWWRRMWAVCRCCACPTSSTRTIRRRARVPGHDRNSSTRATGSADAVSAQPPASPQQTLVCRLRMI
jgi:hypothetical protein